MWQFKSAFLCLSVSASLHHYSKTSARETLLAHPSESISVQGPIYLELNIYMTCCILYLHSEGLLGPLWEEQHMWCIVRSH